MSGGGSRQPSRVLFRDELDTDEDLMSSDPSFSVNKTCHADGDTEVTTMSPDLYESDQVISSNDGPEGSDDNIIAMSTTPKKSWSDEVEEPSSPFNLMYHQKGAARHSSPTHQHIRNGVNCLRLFGSPKTPKTLLAKSKEFLNEERNVSVQIVTPLMSRGDATSTRGRKRQRRSATPCSANINPFTPNGMLLQQQHKKAKGGSLDGSFLRSNESSGVGTSFMNTFLETDDDSECEMKQDPTIDLMALAEKANYEREVIRNSRFHRDFLRLEEIGSGEFGNVSKCLNRVDGCIYAIKQSRKPTKGCPSEKRALIEVFAHAVLGKHNRVVRYYSAWSEDEQMFIQNEYCDGGSLAALIDETRRKEEKLTEAQLKKILRHVAQGLRCIHSQKLVHMDIKPENIFICTNSDVSVNGNVTLDSTDDGFEEIDSECELSNEVSYKIGDLGLVTSMINGQVEEGDCRYMPLEILQDNFVALDKADVFALGLTVYEAATLTPLPKNGDTWHMLRHGHIESLDGYSEEFTNLVRKMTSPEPELRPSASALLQDPFLVPYGDKSKSQLRRELNGEKFKNEVLTRQLEEAKVMRSDTPPLTQVKLHSGEMTAAQTKFYRSRSVTTF